jgi:hypothetical protein
MRDGARFTIDEGTGRVGINNGTEAWLINYAPMYDYTKSISTDFKT